MKKYIVLFFVLFTTSLFAQKKNENFKMHIQKSTGNIKIDGVLDENAWFQSAAVSDFMMCNPFDSLCAQVRTDVKMTYDDMVYYNERDGIFRVFPIAEDAEEGYVQCNVMRNFSKDPAAYD